MSAPLHGLPERLERPVQVHPHRRLRALEHGRDLRGRELLLHREEQGRTPPRPPRPRGGTALHRNPPRPGRPLPSTFPFLRHGPQGAGHPSCSLPRWLSSGSLGRKTRPQVPVFTARMLRHLKTGGALNNSIPKVVFTSLLFNLFMTRAPD